MSDYGTALLCPSCRNSLGDDGKCAQCFAAADAIVPVSQEPEEVSDVVEGYYRFIGDPEDSNPYKLVADELVYVTKSNADQVFYVRVGSSNCGMGLAEFFEKFDFEPNGEELRHNQMTDLMGEVHELNQGAAQLGQTLADFRPHIVAGQAVGMDLPDTSDLAVVSGTPVAAKRAIAGMKNGLAKYQAAIKAKAAEMQALMSEQVAIMTAKVGELDKIVKKAEEVIWTINLYLGKDEYIHVLRQGHPASTDEPLVLRQLVLYMDEECALDPEEMGIDAQGIDKFDAWLLSKPEHLDQILPEIKGMVAIKVRHTDKDYGNRYINMQMAEANHKTYFLIRNGENLYRLWIDYDTGATMVPQSNTFTQFFRREDRDFHTGEVTVRYLQPGSKEYMDAEEKAGDTQRHYMRLGLILQGLIDRTTIFHPMSQHIQVNKPEHYGTLIRVINDAEMGLPDGRERFDDWQNRVNGALEPGMRIMGSFGQLASDYDKGKHSRLSPITARTPSSTGMYTIAGKRGGGFYFYYDRNEAGEHNYRDWDGDGTFKRQASCQVFSWDRCILNFDVATVEEMEFYLTSRLDRQSYMWLFPVLKRAIALKHEEAAVEAPFLDMLAGQIVTAYGVDFAEARAAVPDLLHWWKFKNKTHRALTADDAKALRMLVDEYNLRQREQRKRARLERSGEFQKLLGVIKCQLRDPGQELLLVAHKAGNEFVALVAANEDKVFVHEETWRLTGSPKAIQHSGTRSWTVVDNRYQRWYVLYTGPRWADWRIGASRWEHLTDPEVADFSTRCLAHARSTSYREWENGYDVIEVTLQHVTGMAYDSKAKAVIIYGWVRECIIPKEDILSNHLREPILVQHKYNWVRGPDRTVDMVPIGPRRNQLSYTPGFGDKERCLGNQGTRRGESNCKVLRTWPENNRPLARMDTLIAEHKAAVRVLSAIEDAAYDSIKDQYLKLKEQQAYHAFIQEFGDPELWEGHKKLLKDLPTKDSWRDHTLRFVLRRVVERGYIVNGRSMADIFADFRAESGKRAATDATGSQRRGVGWLERMDPQGVELDVEYLSMVVDISEDLQARATVLVEPGTTDVEV